MPSNVEQVRLALRKFKAQSLNPSGLVARIARKASLTEVEVMLALSELKKSGEIFSDSWDPRGRPVAKLHLALSPEPRKAYEQQWNEVLMGFVGQGLEGRDVEALSPCAGALRMMPRDDMASLVEGLLRLRTDLKNDQVQLSGARAFDVSARYLLGASKLIKLLPNRALADFGISADSFAGPPRYVLVAGALSPKATILVENPHAFEAAVLADRAAEFAWVATYGYGLSKQDESFGDQLAGLVEAREEVITLSRRGPPIDFTRVLTETQEALYFWGDLDLAGLDIYKRLKASLPTLSLSGLYQPMVAALMAGGGHNYLGVQKERQSCGRCDCPQLATFAILCKGRGVDQESVVLTPDNIVSMASSRLDFGSH